jgi:putative hydrolase of the HAD superfamily
LQQTEEKDNMRNLELPSLVVFDLDDTLYDYEKANRCALNELIIALSEYGNLGKEEAASAISASRAIVKRRLGKTASSHSRILYISESFRQLQLKPNTEKFVGFEELYWNAFLEDIQLFQGAEKLLKFFQKSGIRLALVTDLTSSIQYRKISKLGLNGFFELIVTSEEAGGDKSTGLPFRLLESLMETDCSSAWFFGDSSFDRPIQSNLETLFFKKVMNLGVFENLSGYEFSDYLVLEKKLIAFASFASLPAVDGAK